MPFEIGTMFTSPTPTPPQGRAPLGAGLECGFVAPVFVQGAVGPLSLPPSLPPLPSLSHPSHQQCQGCQRKRDLDCRHPKWAWRPSSPTRIWQLMASHCRQMVVSNPISKGNTYSRGGRTLSLALWSRGVAWGCMGSHGVVPRNGPERSESGAFAQEQAPRRCRAEDVPGHAHGIHTNTSITYPHTSFVCGSTIRTPTPSSCKDSAV